MAVAVLLVLDLTECERATLESLASKAVVVLASVSAIADVVGDDALGHGRLHERVVGLDRQEAVYVQSLVVLVISRC